jgi:hypothetical protein
MLHRLHPDIIKRVLMPLLDFRTTEALERTCKSIRQGMRARDLRGVTGYDCFKMIHRDVSAAVKLRGLDVQRSIESYRRGLCVFSSLYGKAFQYMRRLCYWGGGAGGGLCNTDTGVVLEVYRCLGIKVPHDLRAGLALLSCY